MSVPITGGDITTLSDAPTADWVVGRLGKTLVIQPDGMPEGVVLRANVDGSGRGVLVESGRYLGAVTAACGAVLPYEGRLTACPEP